MEFLFYYHYFSGWLLKYIYHFYLFIYFCIIFLHTNLPYFVKRPRAIVIDWALYKYFYYYLYYYNNYTGPKHNTHELDRSTMWQRMWKLRMRMQQRVGMFFPCFFTV